MTATKLVLMGAAALSILALAACDNGPSAVASAPAGEARTADAGDRAETFASEDRRGGRDAREEEVRLVSGKPMWSASRRYSAEENARRAFERNGEAFGAGSVDAFVEKAHAFVHNPPRGAETITRANGDVLIYDARANVFAVRSKDGAPRTMFKPDDGAAYWTEQKARESQRSSARSRRDDDAA